MAFDPGGAARWIAEAVATGNPLAALPDDIAPPGVAQGEAVALAVLAQLEIAPCGLRLLFRDDATPLAGPMIEGRLLPEVAAVALGALRHARVTAAAIGVLAEPLEEYAETPPVFAGVHPALDVSATRFGEDPGDDALLAADLARLGLVVAGRRRAVVPAVIPVSLGQPGVRRRARACDLMACFAAAAAAARRLGGLPAGALLVVAGLTPAAAAEGALSASMGALGRVGARFA